MLQRDVRRLTQSDASLLFFFFCIHEAQVFGLLSLWGDILISFEQVKNSLIVTIISIIVDSVHLKDGYEKKIL